MTFNPYFTGYSSNAAAYYKSENTRLYLSILILLDIALMRILKPLKIQSRRSFNPYFTGYSSNAAGLNYIGVNMTILSILILLDIALMHAKLLFFSW